LPLPDGRIREIPGGPATYIGGALRRLGFACRMITGEHVLVDVLRGDHGEEYVIPAIPKIALPPTFDTEAVILSPIIREIDPDAVPEVKGMLVLDLQGFVRQPGRSSAEAAGEYELGSLLRRASVVKASPNELERLTEASRQAMPSTCLLVITHGVEGLTVRFDGGEQFLPALPIRAPYTIGAGDTLLAGIVTGLLQKRPPLEAVERSMRFTEVVLKERRAAQVTVETAHVE
ncbi:MAG: PfkB family carbohydrate kinase, partial [Chloroflexota bacterium]